MRRLAILTLTLLVSACGGGGGGDNTPQAPPPSPPSASFAVSSPTGTAPLSVTFTDTSNAGTSAITGWEWDFGDGATSAERNPVHEYIGVGNYNVSLTVTTSTGSDTESQSNAVAVDASPIFIEPNSIATFADADEGDILASQNQVLVLLDEGISQSDFDALVSQAKAIGGVYQALDRDLHIVQFYAESGQELTLRDQLRNEPGVLSSFLNRAETPDQLSGSQQDATGTFIGISANDEKVPAVLGVTPGGTFWWLSDVNAEAAWQAVADDPELSTTMLSVIDTGLPSPQALMDESRVKRIDYLGNNISGDTAFDPDNWRIPGPNHGYIVAGFAAGFNNIPGEVVRGINPNTELISVDILNRGFTDRLFSTDLFVGAKFSIISGAKVVNVSYGIGKEKCSTSFPATVATTRFRARFLGLARYAKERDVNLVFASGNGCEKNDDSLFPFFTDGGILFTDVETREKYEDYWVTNALNVGSADDAGRDSCFSVTGDAVDILAPGDEVNFTQNPLYPAIPASFSGTSYAAPIVAGTLALIRSTNPLLEAPEAKYVLMRNARQGSVSFRSQDENISSCASRNVTFADKGAASAPNLKLDSGGAIEGALLTRNINQTQLPAIGQLDFGEIASAQIDVTIPVQGVRALDLVFLIDQSSSYGDDIDTLQSQANTIIEDLAARDIDLRIAVVGFSDFPISPYGVARDREFNLLQNLTSDIADVQAAIDRLDQPLLLGGFTIPEGQYEALFQSANQLSYRDGAQPVIILATDADFHNSDVEPDYPGTGRLETIRTLQERGIKVIGLLSGSSSGAAARLQELAIETNGAFFSLDSSSSEIAQAIADAIDAAVSLVDVTLEIVSGAPWVESISPTLIRDVAPGQTVSFNVEFRGQKLLSDFFSPSGYDVHLWARSDSSALIGRYKQSIGP